MVNIKVLLFANITPQKLVFQRQSILRKVISVVFNLCAAQIMVSEKVFTHNELLISEPSGDANNPLLIHQGHYLNAR